MKKLFYYDFLENERITYNKLIQILNKGNGYYYSFCYEQKYIHIFIMILKSILNNDSITLLDSDFSKNELEKISVNNKKLTIKKYIKYRPIKDFDDMISRIQKASLWRINLFTSGTTGIPKRITHTIYSLTKEAKISKEKFNNVWGFAYNPTHMAGLQVFFQALLNYNSIINLFKIDKDNIFRLIHQFNVSNISATPTFFRQLIPFNSTFPTVKRITFGGEKYDNRVANEIQNIFPNAKLLNVYASTEAGTLFASKGDIFTVKDKYTYYVKIVNNELLIHKKLLGKFPFGKIKDNNWYHTGDMVKIIQKEPLRFIFKSRKNEIINVGGYNVYPYEVEELIRQHPKVNNVIVYGKPNSVIGNLVCADLELIGNNISKKEIRIFLKDKLQNYKIPRIINFVEEIRKARTGKAKRI